MSEQDRRLWHVTLTVAGDTVEPMLLRGALSRLREERPFIDTVEFTQNSAELQFWDEGAAMLDVASLALRLWSEHRESAGLPNWETVGLEVVEKSVRDTRGGVRSDQLTAPAPHPFHL
ncbi:hypothetical protein EFK50_08605 [Nocardioides marmoriginsengisoli]|uniref:Uncharacterized protein n=1 Tax=Nocardioides marmoriginsengisoli TaxID=661483 RepID=A0A3N0CJZ4_9ACTN|nr:hypothetical protein [Nocardioides marmoriginsengisoli]RNL63777.1 hypothetical protein EFK50_08605 [Nocardioides marmoriginsengisoli]